MKKSLMLIPALLLVAVLSLGGCATLGARDIVMASEVVPGPGENVTVDKAFLIVDASGSMHPPAYFPRAKALAQSFVEAMPNGDYEAGLISYGGEWVMDWVHHPLRPFNRNSMRESADQIRFLAGSTPLAGAIELAQPDLIGRPGPAAVVILSDGRTDPEATIAACHLLRALHPGGLCIYTVQLGSDEAGADLLQRVADVTGCGNYRPAAAIASAEGMDGFIREVFLAADRDSDGDGVLDQDDRCPNTPRGATVNEEGCWVLGGVLFAVDKATIKPQFASLLDDAAQVLKDNPGVYICVEGHTDSTATAEYNLGLSQRRADAVRAALIERGVAPKRLLAEGHGESHPVANNNSAAGRAKNRRVELTVIN